MISEKVIRKIFNEVKKDRLFEEEGSKLADVRVHIKTGEEGSAIANLETREITIFLNNYNDEDDYRCDLWHEFLHLYYLPKSPIILNNTIAMLMSYLNLKNSKKNKGYASEMTNVIFDMIVDKRLSEMDVLNVHQFHKKCNSLLKFLSEHNLSIDNLFMYGYFQGCLASYYTALTGNNILNLKNPYLKIGEKTLNIINSRIDIVEKIKDIAFLLNQFRQPVHQ